MGAAWVYTRSGGAWTQQGSKLVGSGNTGAADQGSSVSLSADGNTAIVGGSNDNSGVGAAWVYTRSGGIWVQQGPKLVGTGGVGSLVYQGSSVSLSADGNTAIVGGPADNGDHGAAWVYTRSAGAWAQQGLKLVGTGIVGSEANQGSSVSLSADGNTAMVGGFSDNTELGAAWVYTRSSGAWAQQGLKLVGTGVVGGVPRQGTSVSLSADGSTGIVGGDVDNSNQGAAWVYIVAQPPSITSFSPASGAPGTLVTINGANLSNPTVFSIGSQSPILVSNTGSVIVAMVMPGAATGVVSIITTGGTASGSSNFIVTATKFPSAQQGAKLAGTGGVGTPQQGYAVSLSADGNTAIAGGYADNGGTGAAWVYTRTGGVWTQQAKLVGAGTGSPEVSWQGYSVSLSADGNTAIVGGPQDNGNLGAAWVYVRSGGVWTQQGAKLVGIGSLGGGARVPNRAVLYP